MLNILKNIASSKGISLDAASPDYYDSDGDSAPSEELSAKQKGALFSEEINHINNCNPDIKPTDEKSRFNKDSENIDLKSRESNSTGFEESKNNSCATSLFTKDDGENSIGKRRATQKRCKFNCFIHMHTLILLTI